MTISYTTLIGGSDYDKCLGIAVDQNGNAYVYGISFSVDFPFTPDAYATGSGGGIFIAKIPVDGTRLVYSTYNGSGTATDFTGTPFSPRPTSIAVDNLGNAFLTGSVNIDVPGTSIPLVNADQTTFGGPTGEDGVTPGKLFTPGDMFLEVMDPAGKSVIYSTYYGGNSDEIGEHVVVDNGENVYVTGWTDSFFDTQGPFVEYPTTPGAFDTTYFAVPVNPPGAPVTKLPPNAFLTKFRVTGAPYLNSLNAGYLRRPDGRRSSHGDRAADEPDASGYHIEQPKCRSSELQRRGG